MLWFALILPDLPLQVFTRGVEDAGLLAVVEPQPRATIVIATAAARVRGVELRQGVAGALAVVPELALRERDPALEAATLAELATWAGRFTPCVSLDPPDAVLLEASASLRLFGGIDALAQRIADAALPLGLTTTLAAAPTPLAARWFARARPGTLVRPSDGWARALDALPIELLADGAPVPPATLELLRGVGVRRIGELARLPRDGLARRDASVVTDTVARARGHDPDPRPRFVPAERFASRLVLPASVTHTEPLRFAAGRLFSNLAAWLALRQAGLDCCRLHLEHDCAPATVVEIITGRPQRDAARFVQLACEHLAALTLPAPVEALRLTADAPVALPACTPDLFGGENDAAREAAIRLLDRLRARLGIDAVHTVLPVADHRPERAWRPAAPGTRPAPHPATLGPRPLWLMQPPRPLGAARTLTLLSGPERIESGWWDGDDVHRDYYVAHTAEGALWWVFERLDPPGGWYVHGFFG